MAAFRKVNKQFLIRILQNSRSFATNHERKNNFTLKFISSVLCGGGIALAWHRNRSSSHSTLFSPTVLTVLAKDKEGRKEEKRQAMQTARELRFLSFASVEYQGNIYMSPQDFLESVTDEQPRPRSGRRRLNDDQIQYLLKHTPKRGKGSGTMFRDLDSKGLISYTEYLFLLCVLTKPQSGFRIAFNMFDTDGNQRVDKKEFLVLEEILTQQQRNQHLDSDLPQHDRTAAKHDMCDTTLTLYFFGKKGRDTLKYEDFYRFMDNLQTEVMELEFNEFSRGLAKISEEEFAKILLRYTTLSLDDTAVYLNRLRERIPDEKGITFQEFKDFGLFLNNIDDFALAMKMYSFLGQPISEEDFMRATKAVTGKKLSSHVTHVVFQLFDKDGDGHLSQEEFISVMKDRIQRGFKSQVLVSSRWDSYKSCVRHEMKNR